jgi:hypothetical protein
MRGPLRNRSSTGATVTACGRKDDDARGGPGIIGGGAIPLIALVWREKRQWWSLRAAKSKALWKGCDKSVGRGIQNEDWLLKYIFELGPVHYGLIVYVKV